MTNEPQYALQILVNSGSPRAYWGFDSDYAVRTTLGSALADLDEAEHYGYRRECLRVVEIRPVPDDAVGAR